MTSRHILFILVLLAVGIQFFQVSGSAAESDTTKAPRAEAGQSLAEEARRYLLGNGVSQDYDKAFGLFRRAADSGNAMGQNGLGVCFFEGRGVKKDVAEALKWFRLAAGQGFAKACLNLAEAYKNGDGVKRDPTAALAYALLAAGIGDPGAYDRATEIAQDMAGTYQRDAVALAEKTRKDKGWKITIPDLPGALGRLLQTGTGFFIRTRS